LKEYALVMKRRVESYVDMHEKHTQHTLGDNTKITHISAGIWFFEIS
jgi:hypothetical protein